MEGKINRYNHQFLKISDLLVMLVIRNSTLMASAARDLQDIELVSNTNVIQRVLRVRFNPFENYNDRDFQQRFRFTKSTVVEIIHLIAPAIQTGTERNLMVIPEQQVLLFLYFLSSGAFHRVTDDSIQVHEASACRSIHRVARALIAVRSDFIQFPTNQRDIKDQFHAIANFPGCIEVIDCTHIAISKPSIENPEMYRNRKGFFSLNVQVVADAQMNITNIVCRYPGSTHDARIWDNCRLCANFEASRFDGHLLGDSGYPLRKFLLTPFFNPSTASQRRYNTSHRQTRCVIERLFGIF